MFKVQTDSCLKELKGHTDVVTRVLWLPNGTGFLSGGMDRKIILWVNSFIPDSD